jgi:hypothetical protein
MFMGLMALGRLQNTADSGDVEVGTAVGKSK